MFFRPKKFKPPPKELDLVGECIYNLIEIPKDAPKKKFFYKSIYHDKILKEEECKRIFYSKYERNSKLRPPQDFKKKNKTVIEEKKKIENEKKFSDIKKQEDTKQEKKLSDVSMGWKIKRIKKQPLKEEENLQSGGVEATSDLRFAQLPFAKKPEIPKEYEASEEFQTAQEKTQVPAFSAKSPKGQKKKSPQPNIPQESEDPGTSVDVPQEQPPDTIDDRSTNVSPTNHETGDIVEQKQPEQKDSQATKGSKHSEASPPVIPNTEDATTPKEPNAENESTFLPSPNRVSSNKEKKSGGGEVQVPADAETKDTQPKNSSALKKTESSKKSSKPLTVEKQNEEAKVASTSAAPTKSETPTTKKTSVPKSSNNLTNEISPQNETNNNNLNKNNSIYYYKNNNDKDNSKRNNNENQNNNTCSDKNENKKTAGDKIPTYGSYYKNRSPDNVPPPKAGDYVPYYFSPHFARPKSNINTTNTMTTTSNNLANNVPHYNLAVNVDDKINTNVTTNTTISNVIGTTTTSAPFAPIPSTLISSSTTTTTTTTATNKKDKYKTVQMGSNQVIIPEHPNRVWKECVPVLKAEKKPKNYLKPLDYSYKMNLPEMDQNMINRVLNYLKDKESKQINYLEKNKNNIKNLYKPITKDRCFVVDSKNGHKYLFEESGMNYKYSMSKKIGEIPCYLERRKEELEKIKTEFNKKLKEKIEAQMLKKVDDDERIKLIMKLTQKKNDLQLRFNRLSSSSSRNSRIKMEKELSQIDMDLMLLCSHHEIYVANY